ncbi:MAG TPA: FliM/FliN family flagellar motor switch protein [Terracidiphilus sp.]|nr:FliM/FliN family flagellar motor switch protein [Terracidiphilus sp.]
MATSVPTAPQAAAPPRPAAAGAQPVKAVPAGQNAPATALVPVSMAVPPSLPEIPADSPVMRLKVELEVSVPVGNFRVRNLLALEPGVVVESRWNYSDDLPLAAGRVQLAWTEFEVVDTHLAARLTRLA